MSWENPPVPHEVNVSRESVLAEFLRLLAGLGICVLILAAVLYLAGGWLARWVPFSTEAAWVGDRVIGLSNVVEAPADAEHTRILERLRTLTARVAANMDLPQGMSVRVHLSDNDVPNAFATLGGHLVVNRGLYRRMPSENALALVIAHEVGHIKARDPIAAVGGGASLALLMVALGGDARSLAPGIARLVQLGYSRQAESAADTEALLGLQRMYGHAGGAAAVFEVLDDYGREHREITMPTLLSTHPADARRIQRMREAAGQWNGTPALVPLSAEDGMDAPQ
ncbi:MAG: M48 family metallopeptidase [Elusimicrobia bacterium]|nr:MAG: M48 family metallopeptidase [Gammaproteobacteria bacterium]TXH25747.1 MAG: M48 family metallopeptidase [Elusimicrobiota bacterium]